MSDSDSDSDSSLLAAYYTFHTHQKKKTEVARTEGPNPGSNRTGTAACDSSSSRIDDSHMDGGKENNYQRKADASAAQSLASRKTAPKPTFTGSREQPMCLHSSSDDSDSDDSSILEVLAPRTKKQPEMMEKKAPLRANTRGAQPPRAVLKKPPLAASSSIYENNNANTRNQFSLADSSDSDSSLCNAAPMFATSRRKAPGKPKTSRQDSTSSVARRQPTTSTDRDTEREQELKKRDQAGQKQEKLAQKRAEQARKKAERDALREEKVAQKKADQESRKRQRLEQQQNRGNFATQEMVLLVDPPLFRRPRDHADCYDWKGNEEMEKYGLTVHEYPSVLGGRQCHAMQWIRREHLKGGANEAWQQLREGNVEGYTHLDRLVIVMDDPKVFIDLLRRTPEELDDDDYPELRRWLFAVENGWRAAWPQSCGENEQKRVRPKLMILLLRGMEELDRQWVQHRRAHKNSQRRDVGAAPPTSEEFHDALTWLVIQFKVECMLCDSYEEIWTTAFLMTRALANAPYKKPVSELDCIKKLKPQIPATADGSAPSAIAIAKDCWVRQLQQIPGISETMARRLACHYPTLQDLWRAYQVADNPEELVAGCLSDKTYQQKKAQSIHRLFTSLDPEELI